MKRTVLYGAFLVGCLSLAACQYPDQIYLGISSQSPQHGGCTSIIEDITLSHDNVGDFRMGE